MARILVDSSVVAAILFNEPEGERLARELDGSQLFAPTLLPYEVANVASKKARRFPEVLSALGRFRDLGIELVEVEPEGAASVAIESGLTAYDGAYLFLARALGVSISSLDKKLLAAAKLGKPARGFS